MIRGLPASLFGAARLVKMRMERRTFLPLVGSALVCAASPGAAGPAADRPSPPRLAGETTLASAPIDVEGDWGGSLPQAAHAVVSRMRDACLAGVRLVSDRQPERIRVDNHAKEPPHIWLHLDRAPFAWIVVDIGPRDWSRLAYQFGHEFGHVVCNIWSPEGNSANPSAAAWLEEALAEAFSIRGLGLLADAWATNPPFPGDSAFADAIRQYRDQLVTRYETLAAEEGASADLTAWFHARRDALAGNGDITGPAGGAVTAILAEMTADPAGIEALGALSRWPPQRGLSVEDYLGLWAQSSAELGASRRLPMRLRRLLIG
jgi:hypothetical protein